VIDGQWSLKGDGVTGFARDISRGEPLWVELLAGGECMGIALANLPEPANSGFYLPLPGAALEEGAPLAVRVVNTGIFLKETGKSDGVDERETGGSSLAGDIYVDRGLTITGWVLDPARSEQKLRIFASVDDEAVANTVAAAHFYRLGLADGHGFRLELPQSLADGKSHVVTLKDENGRRLPGSPFRVRSMAQNAAHWLKNQKKIDKPLQEMLAGLLENMEERLPGVIGEAGFTAWKKAFPVPQPAGRQKASVEVWGDAGLLRGQQGVDIRGGAGEYVLLPGKAARLHPHAMAHMLAAIREHEAALVYADSEDCNGQPLFKPCFDREAFLANDYLGMCLARGDVLASHGITPKSGRFDAIMAAAESGRIAHLPLLLSSEDNGAPQENRETAISAWLEKNYPGASYADGRVRYELNTRPRVSIIIPTRDHGDMLKVCLDSLRQTDWPDYEIILIDNGSKEEKALAVLSQAENRGNVGVLRRPGVFNYASLNNEAASLATGGLICFLNNDTEALHPEWLSELAAPLLMAGDEGGCAGAKLLWPNSLVQHGGVIVGTHKLAAHVGNQWLEDEPGYMGRNQFAQQYSAVTAACMLTRRVLFLEAGGFDARRFPVAFNDVDYCLRLRGMEKKIFWTPHSRLAHHESASRGKDMAGSAKARAEREIRFFRTIWGHYDDPFYNPNLPLCAGVEPFLGLAFPPGPREARIV